jgi:hypothetical protein
MSLINKGSVDDVRSTLRLEEPKLSIQYLTGEIEKERKGLGRTTVINMLKAAIKRKTKSKPSTGKKQ